MVKLKQAIVVEGRYDVNTLRQLVDAPIFETRGFGIMNDRERLALLRAAARRRGLIILTDSDGAGFVIRNFLKNALHGENILQAYIPDIYGKEKRKSAPGKEGKLGVEGMRPEVLLEALRRAGATFEGDAPQAARTGEEITRADLLDRGLIGPGSAEKRAALLKTLRLPEHLSTAALVQTLNLLMSREEFERL